MFQPLFSDLFRNLTNGHKIKNGILHKIKILGQADKKTLKFITAKCILGLLQFLSSISPSLSEDETALTVPSVLKHRKHKGEGGGKLWIFPQTPREAILSAASTQGEDGRKIFQGSGGVSE